MDFRSYVIKFCDIEMNFGDTTELDIGGIAEKGVLKLTLVPMSMDKPHGPKVLSDAEIAKKMQEKERKARLERARHEKKEKKKEGAPAPAPRAPSFVSHTPSRLGQGGAVA